MKGQATWEGSAAPRRRGARRSESAAPAGLVASPRGRAWSNCATSPAALEAMAEEPVSNRRMPMFLDSRQCRGRKASPIVDEGIALGCDTLARYALQGHSKRAFGMPLRGESVRYAVPGALPPATMVQASGLRQSHGGFSPPGAVFCDQSQSPRPSRKRSSGRIRIAPSV